MQIYVRTCSINQLHSDILVQLAVKEISQVFVLCVLLLVWNSDINFDKAHSSIAADIAVVSKLGQQL